MPRCGHTPSRISSLNDRLPKSLERGIHRWLARRIRLDDPDGLVRKILVSTKECGGEKLASTSRGVADQVLGYMVGTGLAVSNASALGYFRMASIRLRTERQLPTKIGRPLTSFRTTGFGRKRPRSQATSFSWHL